MPPTRGLAACLSVLSVGAPKSRIGGSGTTALPLAFDMLALSPSLWLLQVVAGLVVPFFTTLLMGIPFALLAVLWAALRVHRRSRIPGRRADSPCALARLVCSLGVASPSKPIVSWHRGPVGRRPGRQCLRPSRLDRFLLAFFGFCHLPVLVWAAPVTGGQARFVGTFLPGGAGPEVMSGACATLPDLLDSSETCIEPDRFYFVPAGPPGPPPPSPISAPILGVSVYAPFYAPISFGLHVPEGTNVEAILAVVHEVLPG